jgi:lysophospholipase L1-like esterase
MSQAQPWVSFETHTRYLAMGDSVSAGYGAMPVTHGFTYNLYQSNVIDNVNNTLFCPMAVPGALSQDVLLHQVPQARLFLADTGAPYRKVITLTVGANDLLQVLVGADPNLVLQTVGTNLAMILGQLRTLIPDGKIYVANYYDPKLPVPGEKDLVMALNQVIVSVVASLGTSQITVVDIFTAFEGRSGLLLAEKKGSDLFEVHPTNAGYRVITDAFADAIKNR